MSITVIMFATASFVSLLLPLIFYYHFYHVYLPSSGERFRVSCLGFRLLAPSDTRAKGEASKNSLISINKCTTVAIKKT